MNGITLGGQAFGMMGAAFVMGIAALGSAIGIGIAGSSTVSAWKRCYKANKPAPMTLLVFAGAPLTQTFYGFILMGQMMGAATEANGKALLVFGIAAGLAMAMSAISQGKTGAAAADALSDTGKGFANYIAVVGLCETVALFAMVLSMTTLSNMNASSLGMIGASAVMGIAAVGSAIGIGIAGSSAIGSWKRCYKANKPAPMTLLVFAGAPLTQTFYGFILLGQMIAAVAAGANGGLLLGLGIASGVAMALSAIAQGKAGAAGADALSDTGKGFANYVAVVGLCETVALFAMVLSMTSLSGGVGTPELGMIGAGLVMGIAALGSAIGIGIAGSSTIASWKRSYKANKPAPMTLLVFAGAPLTQTFYGFILMGQMIAAASRVSGGLLLGFGVGSGVAMALSAIAQGKAGAAGSDALGDTGKGFANYIAVVGLCETVALFAMVLSMTSLS